MKRGLLLLSVLVLATLAFFWCDLHWIIPGWWRGEAFYQGRPTSYWRSELGHWRVDFYSGKVTSLETSPPPILAVVYQWMPFLNANSVVDLPPILLADPNTTAVMKEIRDSFKGEVCDAHDDQDEPACIKCAELSLHTLAKFGVVVRSDGYVKIRSQSRPKVEPDANFGDKLKAPWERNSN